MHAGRTTIVALAALALVGCSGGEKEQAGTVIGAGRGALAGAHVGKGKLVAVAVGTLAGAALGGEVGKSLDRSDRPATRRSAQTALEKNRTGAASTWRNPERSRVTDAPAGSPTGPGGSSTAEARVAASPGTSGGCPATSITRRRVIAGRETR